MHTVELFRLAADSKPVVILTTVVLAQDKKLEEAARDLVRKTNHHPPPDGVNVRDESGNVVFTWLAGA